MAWKDYLKSFQTYSVNLRGLYTRYPIVARAWPSARASKGILHTTERRDHYHLGIK